MSQHHHFDARRSLTALEQDSTIIAVIEMSQSRWLVAGLVPGLEREPLKKLDADEEALLSSCSVGAMKLARLGRALSKSYSAQLCEAVKGLASITPLPGSPKHLCHPVGR